MKNKSNLKYKRYWLRFWFLMANRFHPNGEIFSTKSLPNSYAFSLRFNLNELELTELDIMDKETQFEYMNMYIHVQLHLKEQRNCSLVGIFRYPELNPLKILRYLFMSFWSIETGDYSEKHFQSLLQDFMRKIEFMISLDNPNYVRKVI